MNYTIKSSSVNKFYIPQFYADDFIIDILNVERKHQNEKLENIF